MMLDSRFLSHALDVLKTLQSETIIIFDVFQIWTIMGKIKALLIAPYHSLVKVAEQVATNFPGIDLTVHEGDLQRGLEVALGSFKLDYDVVISRGGTAQMLEDEFTLPVIEIAVSGADLLRGLAKHNPLGKRCAIVGFSNALKSVEQMADFSDFDLDVFEVTFEDELPLVLQDIIEGHYEVTLCDNFAVEKCRELGIDAHLLESGEQSVGEAFEQALFLCQQISAVQQKNHVLWELLKSLPSTFTLFTPAGRLVYSNQTEARKELLPFMREHLNDPAPSRLVIQREGRVHRVDLSNVGDSESGLVAFNVTSTSAPSSERLVGIERLNRDDVARRYEESVFKVTGGGEVTMPLVNKLAQITKPIMMEGEIGVGKAQIVYLLYLKSDQSNRPLVIIDCSLLVEKSWDYLMNSTNSPLYRSEETIYFKAAHALDRERLNQLLDTLRRSGVAERSRIVFSANDKDDKTETESVANIIETMRCLVFKTPPLRSRADLSTAIARFISNESAKKGDLSPTITDEAMARLCAHQWTKNYIELRQVLQRTLFDAGNGPITSDIVSNALDRESSTRFSSLSTPEASTSIDLLRPIKEIERDIVRLVVEKYGGNQTEAARVLGLSRTTIWRLLKG